MIQSVKKIIATSQSQRPHQKSWWVSGMILQNESFHCMSSSWHQFFGWDHVIISVIPSFHWWTVCPPLVERFFLFGGRWLWLAVTWFLVLVAHIIIILSLPICHYMSLSIFILYCPIILYYINLFHDRTPIIRILPSGKLT
jgi:hypothetical protein